MEEKACCVTGHRDIPADKVAYVKEKLLEEIEAAIADGYTTFRSGFAEGADLLFAALVLKLKEENPRLLLEAAIPYKTRLNSKNPLRCECFAACDLIHIQQDEYSRDAPLNRNRYMVMNSTRVIAVYGGREKGGMVFTMRCARTLKKEIRVIRV